MLKLRPQLIIGIIFHSALDNQWNVGLTDNKTTIHKYNCKYKYNVDFQKLKELKLELP